MCVCVGRGGGRGGGFAGASTGIGRVVAGVMLMLCLVLSALQGEAPTHIGVDNLNVVNHILSIGEVEAMVGDGRVRQLDWLRNDAADEAADFGRRRVSPGVLG